MQLVVHLSDWGVADSVSAFSGDENVSDLITPERREAAVKLATNRQTHKIDTVVFETDGRSGRCVSHEETRP